MGEPSKTKSLIQLLGPFVAMLESIERDLHKNIQKPVLLALIIEDVINAIKELDMNWLPHLDGKVEVSNTKLQKCVKVQQGELKGRLQRFGKCVREVQEALWL